MKRRPPAYYKGTRRLAKLGDRVVVDILTAPNPRGRHSVKKLITGVIIKMWFCEPLHKTGYHYPWAIRFQPNKYQKGIKQLRNPVDGTISCMLEYAQPLDEEQ